ncbi:MAG: hypothetical protein EOM06_07790 [Sphingobacteriia bacterium]|nr:hypothetical protein [Sphingobacteriia bacterium]
MIQTKKVAELNRDQCLRIAEIIRNLKPRKDFYQRNYLRVEADEETIFRMHFFAVAICHQTYTLHHPKLNLWGWDFIEHVFAILAKEKSQLLNPSYLVSTDSSKLVRQLKNWFTYDEEPDHCTLDRPDERVALMQDAAGFVTSEFKGKLSSLFRSSKGFLIHSGTGLYEVLPKMQAFTDSQQKKSTFLIKLLMDAGLITINDPENFIPIMDYHMQRVLMRTGCVEITDPDLRQQLINRKPQNSDEPIRSLCIEAFRIIADTSGHQVTRMNDYFWSLGRSCCNTTTLCHDHRCEKEPCTLTQIIELQAHSRCIFQDICPGAILDDYRNLWQPMVKTHFY